MSAPVHDDFESELSGLITDILVPLRGQKTLNQPALERLNLLVTRIGNSGAFADSIPTALAGRLWFIYYSMLDEAIHARDPLPIQTAAAAYQEALRTRLFGPTF